MQITLGFSPCPNDTFIFDALVNKRIDTGDIEFVAHLADVEELNRMAIEQKIDVTKLSYHAFAYVMDDYTLLDSGSALGKNCGPILVTKRNDELIEEEINTSSIAIPGRYTTANFLLNLAFPLADQKKEMLFSDIENAVVNGEVDLGLIIHENRFTYEEKGLNKVIDLGEYWDTLTGLPIPLGGIAVRRSLSQEIIDKINRLVRESVKLALSDPSLSENYVAGYAQSMDKEVRDKHIALYVNEYSIDLGSKGREAVNRLFEIAHEKGIIPLLDKSIFTA